ncbi:MAG: glycosyltransferase family 2 protein [Phycisphaeraceae bacterium]
MAALQTACVIPVHNGEMHLGAAIDSVLAQTRPFDEVIVVNDGSTDGTADVLRAYEHRITRIDQPNAGVSAARNRGITAATAPLIALLDGDDLFLPEKNEKQAACFERDPALELCMASAKAFRSEEMTDQQWADDPRNRQGHWDKPLPLFISTWMFRRSLFDRVGPFEGAHGEDTDWLVRARDAQAKELLLDDVLSRRRVHAASVTARWTTQAYDHAPDIFKRHLDRMRAKQKG